MSSCHNVYKGIATTDFFALDERFLRFTLCENNYESNNKLMERILQISFASGKITLGNVLILPIEAHKNESFDGTA